MQTPAPQSLAAAADSSGKSTRGRSRYFPGTGLLLLAFVVTGFGRTFFARLFFDVPPIPWYVFVHGFVLASWFVLFFTQTVLVAAHRTDLHRRLGVLGGVIAVALVGMSLVVVRGFPAHVKAGVLTIDETFPPEVVRAIVWTDLASLLIFSTFVGIALYWRRRPDVHKRLMLLASMTVLGPAVARIVSLLAPPQAVGGAIQMLLLIGLPLTVLLYDLFAERRVHRTTIIGVIVTLVASFGAYAISTSGLGASLIAALEQSPG